MSEKALVLADTSVSRQLSDLAAIARSEDDLAMGAAADAVGHAIQAGLALIEARDQLDHGSWHPWLQENWGRSLNRAQSYMRLARYREIVEAGAPPTILAATKMLVGHADNRIDPRLKEEAKRLRRSGKTWADIADELGRSASVIRRWVDPRTAEHERRRAARRSKAAIRALREKERTAQVRRIGGDLSHAYSAIRKALEALECAAAIERNAESRQSIRSAMASLYNAEDKVVAASSTSKPQGSRRAA